MRLQKRVFMMVMGIQILFIVLMSITTNYRTIRAFSSIEHRFFEQQMSRVQGAVDGEGKSLQNCISDWGAWDRMYSFMETKDVTRFDELLNGNILRALNVDFLAIIDNDMNPIIAYIVDDLGNEIPIEEDMAEPLKAVTDSIAVDSESPPEFLKLGDDVYLFKTTQILTTDWTGPSRGLVVAGMSFSKVLKNVSSSMNLPCNFLPADETGEEWAPLLNEQDEGGLTIKEASGDRASVHQLRGRVLGTDVPYALSFIAQRTIYAEGQRAMYNSYVWLFYNGISLAILMVYFLSRVIIKRLENLRATVDKIINGINLGLRTVPLHEDEIGALAVSFNTLLDTLENVIMQIPDALILSDSSGRVMLLNQEARKLLATPQFSREDEELWMEDIIQKTDDKVLVSEDEHQLVYEGLLCRPDGSTVPVEIHESMLALGAQAMGVYLARDLTERKNLAARIDWNDHHDAYTGLPNRKSFVDMLNGLLKPEGKTRKGKSAAEGNQPLTLVLINMDHFKSINAEVTNTGGDIILAIIAERIKNALEERGTLFRTSGDEFAILFMKDEDGRMIAEEDLNTILMRIRDYIREPCQMGEKPVYPSACMGVLFDALKYGDSSLIIEKATTALKAAKREGLGVITVYREKEEGGEMDAAFAANVLRMRHEIQEALEQEQFIPYFQPVYSIEDRRLSGFETLVRWQHPSRGFLTPYHFVPYAERIGVIGEIDQQMMRCAMKAISDSPTPYYFSANGSSNLMQRPDAAELICNFLDRAHVNASRFAVEVTESVLINNLEGVQHILNLLEGRDVRIFLDDFGTGYSSLQYLQELPFNCLKLDQSFVRQLATSERAAKMLRTIINMANMLGLDTIAEGVETEEQLLWLGDAGCKKAQGYFFAKPLPWKEADKLIRKEYARLGGETGLAGAADGREMKGHGAEA